MASAAPLPASVLGEIAKQGLTGDDAKAFRDSAVEERTQTIQSNYRAGLNALGDTVQTYYTPEQKVAYAQALDTFHSSDAELAITAATAAGLTDREAAWRGQQLLTGPAGRASGSSPGLYRARAPPARLCGISADARGLRRSARAGRPAAYKPASRAGLARRRNARGARQ